jgi:hypothetical protein
MKDVILFRTFSIVIVMDIEEIILETLKIVEDKEINSQKNPCFYTCILNHDSAFSDIVESADACVLASNYSIASYLFFLMEGFFDHGNNKAEWYTKCLNEWIRHNAPDDFDGEITAEVAYEVWSRNYKGCITEHHPTQPIIIDPTPNSVISITPTICDIWTIPRIRRQFTD